MRAAFNANVNGRSSTINLDSGDILQTQGYTNYDLSLATQTRLTDLFSINAGIDHSFASNESSANVASGVAHYSQPGDETGLQLALHYNFVPNAFVISGTYAHDFYDNASTYYADPALDSETRNRNSDTLGVKLYYLMP